MLQYLQDRRHSFGTKIVVSVVIGAFALFGVSSIVGTFSGTAAVAKVNGEEITEQEMFFSTQQLMRSIGADIDTLDEGLIQQIALNQLIDDKILLQSANGSALTISELRIDRQIINTPEFQINGIYDSELAARTIAIRQQTTIANFRNSLKQRMLMSQLAQSYSSSSFVTTAELEQYARLTSQTRSFRYIPITLGTRSLGVAIRDEQIAEYYQQNEQEFMLEEQLTVRYVILDKADLIEEFSIDPAQLREEYEMEKSEFVSTTERRVSHILFEIVDGSSESETIDRAGEVKSRIDSGEDFAAMALEYSADVGSAEDGGDIGFSDGSAFPEAIETALLDMAEGDISDPIVSEFGVHLVKLTEFESSDYPAFEEVRQRLESELNSEQVEEAYSYRLEELSNLAFESGDLQEISSQLELEIQISELFGRSGGFGITAGDRVISAAFSGEVLFDGNNSDVIELDSSRALVLRLGEHNDATLSPRAEVEAEIVVLLRTRMEREEVAKLGEEILQAAENNQGTEDLLSSNELQWIEQPAASRTEPTVNIEILSRVFALAVPAAGESQVDGIALANGTFVVLELTQVNPGELSALADVERIGLTNTLLDQSGRADFESYISNIRERATIVN